MKTVAQTSQNSDTMNMRIRNHEQTLEQLKREVQQARYRDTSTTTARSELFKRQGTDPLEVSLFLSKNLFLFVLLCH
jgi:ABC-type Fe3+-citrate transport system substrate-binding protein